ncbi:MAG: LysR family transcriptional regulator [Gammaproteobacteria bacterium]|nr:LysR family transcriptional regulator [Gammaproteobacteria bacterium]
MSKFQEYRTFIAIVERKSLSHAADKLHKSTSTVSKQLAKLEEDLGATLIERNTQTFTVTPLGEEFYHHCKQILRNIEDAERMVRDRLLKPCGKLSISLPEVLLHTELLTHLAEFARSHSEVKFDVNVSNEVEDLIERGYDFAFRIEPLTDERLVASPLTDVRLLVVASPTFIERHGKPESLAALVESHQLILPSYVNIPRVSRLLGPVVGDQPANIDLSHGATSEAAILAMACEGMGVALLLDVSVRPLIEDGTLVQLFPGEKLLERTVYLVSRSRTHASRLPVPVHRLHSHEISRVRSRQFVQPLVAGRLTVFVLAWLRVAMYIVQRRPSIKPSVPTWQDGLNR